MCKSGKRSFRSEADALAYLVKRLNHWKSNSNRARPIRAYQCDHCQRWHLTHLSKGGPK